MQKSFFDQINNGLIVSCQALSKEPLFGSGTMAKMANAAKQGGAVAIRANGINDIKAIKEKVDLPIIGLIKQNYEDSSVFITPTKKEVDKLIEVGVDVIALDATKRVRPGNVMLEELVEHLQFKKQIIMADVSTLDEAYYAQSLGVDCVSTTLSGYTDYTIGNDGPDFKLMEILSQKLSIPVIAEGKIMSPNHALKAMQLGVHAVVVGSAITRPQIITKQYVNKIKGDAWNEN